MKNNIKSKEKSVSEEKILTEDLEFLIGEKFGNYSKYIIQERALPDLRDGLKPVQRRILYAMNQLKLTYNSPYKKSARVVGDVIGKYHPHGDTSVYEALIRMSQTWKSGIPLIDMHGNNGSIDGDSAAAMRYTETRLSKVSNFLLENIEKDIVSFSPNFDDSEMEPTVLPAKIPNLLINGALGIASGYSTNIPPHNISEIIDALIFALNNEDFTLSNLLKIVKGPDFPTGGIIQSISGIKEAYKTGKGKIVLQAKITKDLKNSQILITEIPFEVNKSDLVRRIDELISQNKIPGLQEIRDDTDRSGLQITLFTKKDFNQEVIINYLLKNTELRKNYHINMIVIKDKKPQLVGLVDILNDFSEFQIFLYRKLYKYELDKLQNRLNVVKSLIKVSQNIDEVILIIKNSVNKQDAKQNLIKKYSFSDYQAESIVNLKLYRLTSTDVNELNIEYKKLLNLINHYQKALKEKAFLVSLITKELNVIKDQFKFPRKSLIEDKITEISIDEEDLINKEDIYLCITKYCYIKSVSLKSKDNSTSEIFGIRNDDIPIIGIKTSNLNVLYIFTSYGRYYKLPIYKINYFKWKDIGDHLSKYVKVGGSETIIAFHIGGATLPKLKGNVIITTKKGLIKQFDIEKINYDVSKAGQKFIKLSDNDSVVSFDYVRNVKNCSVITFTSTGYGLRYNLKEIPVTNLNSSGVKNISLLPNDFVVKSLISHNEDINEGKSKILIFTKTGKAKRIRVKELKDKKRNQRGELILKPVKAYPDEIIGVYETDLQNDIFVLFFDNRLIRFDKPNEILLSDFTTGFSKISDDKIKLIQSDLRIRVRIPSKDYEWTKEVENPIKNEKKKDKSFNVDKLINELEK